MKKIFTFSLLIFACLNVFAQYAPCGFDAVRAIQLKTNPEYRQQEEQINQLLYRQAINPVANIRSSQTTLTIPVVVHIVHMNGLENISDSLVIAAIDQLNLRFQNASPYFDSTGHDIQIQFCLASVDPYGNATTGITRDVSANTDVVWTTGPTNDIALKNVNRWDPHLYLNIWAIRSISSLSGIAGYATYPATVNSAPAYDGIVLMSAYFNNFSLSHEAGHYFGLYHTFEGGCPNDNCLLNGDQVCDTPPDATNNNICPVNSCSTEMSDTSGFNPFSADVDDLPNYMDYTSCPLSFSAGQSDRMNASLTLIRSTLLQSNGCGQNPGGAVPVASFTATASCSGTTLTNTSLNSLGAQWDINNDGTIDDYGNTINFNPPATGSYTVKMYASGYGGTDTISQTVFAQYYPWPNYPLVNGYMGISYSATGILTACEGATITFQGAPGMAHYYWSNGDTTQNTTFVQGTNSFTISLYAVDSAGLTWTACYPIHIEAAAATIPPTISVAPNDTIFCIGSPINLVFTYSPIWYAGSFLGITGFHNSTYAVTLNNVNNYSVTQTDTSGCMSTSNNIFIIAETPTISANIVQIGNNLLMAPGGVHNQWYFNGAPVPNSDTSIFAMTQIGCYKVFYWWSGGYDCGTFSSDSVCLTTLGIETKSKTQPINIFPNPVNDLLTIQGEGIFNTTYKITLQNPVGQILFEKEFNAGSNSMSTQIDMKNLSSGIFFLSVTSNKAKQTFKVQKL